MKGNDFRLTFAISDATISSPEMKVIASQIFSLNVHSENLSKV